MLNVILTVLALAASPTPAPTADKAPIPHMQAETSGPTFRALAVPAGQRPSEEFAVKGVDSTADEVRVDLDPLFEKNGWSCVVSEVVRSGVNQVTRAVACTQTIKGEKKSLAASSTACPIKGEGRNYTTLSLGVGAKNKLAAGVTLILLCQSGGGESQ